MIDNFADDLKTYTLHSKKTQRSDIWQTSRVEDTTSDFIWIIVRLKIPREIPWTLNKIISDYACYTKTNYLSEKWDVIADWSNQYEVIEMQNITWLWWNVDDTVNIHYLQLIK